MLPLCTMFKLIWEAIAGDTSWITPPPPSGFKPATQHAHWTSHGVMWWTKTIIYPIVLHFDVIIATQLLTRWRDEHFFLYQNLNLKQNQLKSTKPVVGENTQLITHLHCKTTRHLNDIQGRVRGTRDQHDTPQLSQ